ncbi:acyltransferase domain-containing protein, partial [Corallococcus sp. 4LFB]|uniref:acyltransferase domain-containing protein n=1 Tax=Corallococcus sp. 4LFB TaxID=3383249 RepID=UPI003974ACF1
QPLLSGRLELAAVNAPDRCVVSGPVEEVERLEAELKGRKAGAVRMPAPHAFHSVDVEPVMPELARVVGTLRRSEPAVRYVSSLMGTVAQPGQLADPRYWTEQMRRPVHFTRAVETLQEEGCAVLLEVGPGQDVTPLVRANLTREEHGRRVQGLASLRVGGATTEQMGWLQAVGELWTAGVAVDWSAFYAHEQRLRMHLPTYVFQEKTVWVEPKAQGPASGRITTATRSPAQVNGAEAVRPDSSGISVSAGAASLGGTDGLSGTAHLSGAGREATTTDNRIAGPSSSHGGAASSSFGTTHAASFGNTHARPRPRTRSPERGAWRR